MLLFMKKAKQEVEKARLLSGVEFEKYLYTKAVDGFIQTEEGKHVMNAVGGSILYQQLHKIGNLESVIETAAEELSQQNTPINDVPIDKDWMTRFLFDAEEISQIEMQKLWGRVLAGEIARPNSFSLRTLSVLKNLSKREAELVNTVAKYHIDSGSSSFLRGRLSDYSANSDIKYGHLLLLSELGIITLRDSAHLIDFMERSGPFADYSVLFYTGNRMISFSLVGLDESNLEKYEKVSIPVIAFTTVGRELLRLIETELNIQELKLLQKAVMQAFDVSTSACYVSDQNLFELGADFDSLSFTQLFDDKE